MAPEIGQLYASEEVTQKFIAILKKNGIFEEVKSVLIEETPDLQGEHMATATAYAKIEFKDSSVKPKNLFIKKYTNNDAHTAWVKQMKLMEKEATFYNDFLPALREFCGKFDRCENLLSCFPNILHADDETIIMNNIVLDDTFSMLCKHEKQDLNTAKFVLSNLAKLHAASFAFVQSMGEEEFKNKWSLICTEALLADEKNPMLNALVENSVAACITILEGNPVEGDLETLVDLKGYIGKALSRIAESVKTKSGRDKMLVVNHGDCWNNNMLFKKDPTTEKVIDHMFVDLQVTRYASPNLDLGFFFFTSIKPELRRNHFKELLRHYYDNLEKTLTTLKQKIPITFDEFVEDYKRKMDYGFFFGLCMVSAIGAMKDIDMNKLNNDAEDMMAMFKNAIDNWIKNNPVKAAEISKEIVAVVREFKNLSV